MRCYLADEDFRYGSEFLFDIPREQMYDIIHHGKNYYRLAFIRGDEAFFEKILFSKDPYPQRCNKYLTCPYCGSVDKESYEFESNEGEYECGNCNSMIKYERIITIDYNTYPVKSNKVSEVKERPFKIPICKPRMLMDEYIEKK